MAQLSEKIFQLELEEYALYKMLHNSRQIEFFDNHPEVTLSIGDRLKITDDWAGAEWHKDHIGLIATIDRISMLKGKVFVEMKVPPYGSGIGVDLEAAYNMRKAYLDGNS